MYSVNDMWMALSDPHLLVREINRQYHQLTTEGQYNDGIDVFEEEWDNLIILDACRFDIFQDEVEVEGVLESRESKATTTSEFIRANFSNRELHDVVYVTGNSWILKIGDGIGADPYAVYTAKDDLDYEQETITEAAIEAAEDHPDKRLMVHFIPPHHPFMGPTAEEHLPSLEEQQSDFFTDVRRGVYDISDELLEQAYRENLQRVIPRVEELLDTLGGKTVVTADHGELLGDRLSPIPIRGYGHVSGLYVDELVEVPWHIYETGERRAITEDPPIQDNIDNRSQEEIDEHLRALGYKM